MRGVRPCQSLILPLHTNSGADCVCAVISCRSACSVCEKGNELPICWFPSTQSLREDAALCLSVNVASAKMTQAKTMQAKGDAKDPPLTGHMHEGL